MTELKEIPTDKLVEELKRRREENTVPRWYFNPELASSAIRLAEVLLND